MLNRQTIPEVNTNKGYTQPEFLSSVPSQKRNKARREFAFALGTTLGVFARYEIFPANLGEDNVRVFPLEGGLEVILVDLGRDSNGSADSTRRLALMLDPCMQFYEAFDEGYQLGQSGPLDEAAAAN